MSFPRFSSSLKIELGVARTFFFCCRGKAPISRGFLRRGNFRAVRKMPAANDISVFAKEMSA